MRGLAFTKSEPRIWSRRGVLAGAGCAALRHALARPAQPQLRAGAAEAHASPPAKGTFLIGPMAPSEGAHDPLYARALVFDDGETRAAHVTLDYLGFDAGFNDRLLAAIEEAAAIPPGRVMIHCSHNHSAPLSVRWGPWRQEEAAPWRAALPRTVGAAAQEAVNRLRPASLAVGREPAQVGFNRRLPHGGKVVMAPNPNGVVLPWVDVLAVNDAQGGRIATLFSHAAHSVIVHGASNLISADYPGFAIEELKRTGGRPEELFLFAQGCCGNINGHPLRGGIGAAAAAGRELGQAVARALAHGGDPLAPARLRTRARELNLPLRSSISPDRLREVIEREEDGERRARREAMLAVIESGEDRTVRTPLRAFAFGDRLCLLGLPHDTFAEYHRHILDVSPFRHTMVFAYTNSLGCYLPTKRDLLLGENGGYEASPFGAALMFETRLPPAPESEEIVRREVEQMLLALHAARGDDGRD